MNSSRWKKHKKYTDAELEAYAKQNPDEVSKVRLRVPDDDADGRTVAVVINGEVHLIKDIEEEE